MSDKNEDVSSLKSILGSVKNIVWTDAPLDDKDTINSLILHTNTVLMALNQMGIGVEGFEITGPDELWSDFLKDTQVNLHAVKTYVGLKVKMMFDPPASAVLKESILKAIDEAEFRIFITENYIDKKSNKRK